MREKINKLIAAENEKLSSKKEEFKYAIETQKVDNINANQVMEIATYLQKVSIEMAKIESVIDYLKTLEFRL